MAKMDSRYFGMLNEDHNAVANLPQAVHQKPFPPCAYTTYALDDTINELDKVRGEDIRDMATHRSKSKY